MASDAEMYDDRTMKPIITLNGTCRESLVEQRCDAMNGVREAMHELQKTAPNHRDYIGEQSRFDRDLKIYRSRFAMLDRLYNELEVEAQSIQG